MSEQGAGGNQESATAGSQVKKVLQNIDYLQVNNLVKCCCWIKQHEFWELMIKFSNDRVIADLEKNSFRICRDGRLIWVDFQERIGKKIVTIEVEWVSIKVLSTSFAIKETREWGVS